jgi:PDGLE domain
MNRARLAVFVGLALAVALALAFFVGPHASSEPDGLARVAIDNGFAGRARDHALANGPLAGYSMSGAGGGLTKGLAGVMGVGLCFVIGVTAVWIVRRVRR